MMSYALEYSRFQALFLFCLLAVVMQFAAILAAIFYMRKRHLGLRSLMGSYMLSSRQFARLEASLPMLQALERVHLASAYLHAAQEVEVQLSAQWADIQDALKQLEPVHSAGKVNFSVLSARGAFELYGQMQGKFLHHSRQGEKALAQHILQSQGQDLRISLDTILKSGAEAGSQRFLAGYGLQCDMDFAWMVYPPVLIFLSFATFLGMQAFS